MGKDRQKLFKEKLSFSFTMRHLRVFSLKTPTGVLIGNHKDSKPSKRGRFRDSKQQEHNIHDTVANPIAILLMKVVLDNSSQS